MQLCCQSSCLTSSPSWPHSPQQPLSSSPNHNLQHLISTSAEKNPSSFIKFTAFIINKYILFYLSYHSSSFIKMFGPPACQGQSSLPKPSWAQEVKSALQISNRTTEQISSIWIPIIFHLSSFLKNTTSTSPRTEPNRSYENTSAPLPIQALKPCKLNIYIFFHICCSPRLNNLGKKKKKSYSTIQSDSTNN